LQKMGRQSLGSHVGVVLTQKNDVRHDSNLIFFFFF